MRVLLFTGKGGVGKTTVAAATATLAAAGGRRTLVMSTDTAHSLTDTFAAPVGAEPTEIAPRLFVHQIDTQRALERSWRDLQDYLIDVLRTIGVEELAAEELAVVPGAEEVLALFELRDQVRGGGYDMVIVDCAPTAETLRLLALPDVLGWYVDRLLPMERRVVGALRPVLDRVAGIPMPRSRVFDALERFHRELSHVREILTAPESSVRLVLTPEAVVVAEARRTLTTLSLYGYRVDAVVANRVFPRDDADDWRRGWVAAQADRLAEIEASFAPLPIYRAPYRPREPIGRAELADFAAAVYAGVADPFAGSRLPDPLWIDRAGATTELVLELPLAQRGEVEVSRTADELVVTVGSYRRVIALPAALARREVTGATLREGRLRVAFTAPPAAGRAGGRGG